MCVCASARARVCLPCVHFVMVETFNSSKGSARLVFETVGVERRRLSFKTLLEINLSPRSNILAVRGLNFKLTNILAG